MLSLEYAYISTVNGERNSSAIKNIFTDHHSNLTDKNVEHIIITYSFSDNGNNNYKFFS